MEQIVKVESDNEDGSNLSPEKDESLRDFKSPPSEPAAQTSSKVKVVLMKNGKKAKGFTSKDIVANSGRVVSRWRHKYKDQLTIESSFFKAANVGNRGGHTCPLCMKYFADVVAGTAHSKNCATKNNVSTKKLLAAVKLQERQGNERVAIGLPAGPYVQPKDKTWRRNRDPVSKKDQDLQLALALSESLQENEMERELEEALLLAGGGNDSMVEMTDAQRRKTLKNFGFTTNKPEVSRDTFEPGRWKRKKNLGPTILETRTQESRDRLLTDKISEVLIGNEAITQVCQQSPSDRVDQLKESKGKVQSRALNKIHRTTERLWDSAQLSAEITNFYVQDLRPVVVSIADCQQGKSLKSRKVKPGFWGYEKDKISSSGSIMKTSGLDRNDKTSKTSEDAQDANNSVEEAINIHVTDRQYRNSLSADWSNTLNVSSMSDIVIIVKDNHIWAHKLVFFVRCSEILLNSEINDDRRFAYVKEKIVWDDIEYLPALAFLEFVYTGVIEKNSHAFKDNRVMAIVRRLARKYRLGILFDYLRKIKSEMDILRDAELSKTKLCDPIVIDTRAMETDNQNLEKNNIEENIAHNDIDVRRDEEFPRKRSTPIGIDRDKIQHEENDFQDLENQTKNGKICQKAIQQQSVVKGDVSDSSSRSIHGEEIVESFVEKSKVSSQKEVEYYSLDIVSVSSSRSTTPDLFDETIDAQRKKDGEKNDEERAEEEGELSGEENLNILAQLIAEDFPIGENSPKPSTSKCNDVEIERAQADSSRRTETPQSPKINADKQKIDESSGSQNLAIKPKSDLSLFIDKVQRINAKSALDSYSEDDTLGMTGDRQRFKNPFNVNNISNESLGKFDDPKKLKFAEHREKNSQIASQNCDESFINEISRSAQTKNNESSFNDETIDPDDENVSMYSKYKRNNEKNNSIVTYRILSADETVIATKQEADDNEGETFSNEISLRETDDTDFDVSLSFLSDTHPAKNIKSDNKDSRDSSMLPKLDDKVKDVNDDSMVSKKDYKDSRGAKSPSTFHERIIEKTNVTDSSELLNEVEIVDEIFVEKSSQSAKKSSFSSSPKNSSRNNEISKERAKDYDASNSGNEKIVKHTAEKSSQKAKSSKTCKEEINDYDSIEINDVIFSQSFENSKQLSQNQTTKKTSHHSKTACDKKTDASFSRAKSPGNKNKDKINTKSLNDNTRRSLTPTKYRKTSYKSPEYDCFDTNEEIFTQSSKNPDASPHKNLTPLTSRKGRFEKNNEIFTQSLENPDASPLGNSTSLTSGKNRFEKNNEIFTQSLENPDSASHGNSTPLTSGKSCLEKNDEIFTQSLENPGAVSHGNSTPLTSGKSPRSPSPILISSESEMDYEGYPVNEPDFNKENTSTNERNNFDRFSPLIYDLSLSPQPGTSRQVFSPSCDRDSSNSARKLLSRSISMPATPSNRQNTRKETNTPKKKSRLSVSQTISPPANYDSMDTPQLKRELDKYGLKPQSRKRARQLLHYINDQLHGDKSSTNLKNSKNDKGVARSDDDESPVNKKSRTNDRDSNDFDQDLSLSQESVDSQVSIIGEETVFPDSADVSPNEIANSTSIKQAFHRLLKVNEKMYRKILTYEPLSLERLHSRLKEQGFKCKLNALMDFLDEECITFKVLQSGKNRTKGRGKKAFEKKDKS